MTEPIEALCRSLYEAGLFGVQEDRVLRKISTFVALAVLASGLLVVLPQVQSLAQTTCQEGNPGGSGDDGYCVAATHWGGGANIPYRVNENAPGVAGELGAIQLAAQSWNGVADAAAGFTYQAGPATNQPTADGINDVFWVAPDIPCPAAALACAIHYGTCTACNEYDLQFNTNVAWSVGAPTGGHFDIQSIATHEFGHWLGLDHPNDFDQVMCTFCLADGQSHRALGWGDINGVRAQRPPATALTRWNFLLRESNSAGTPDINVQYGNPSSGDIPVVGDWTGKGTTGIGVVRPDASGHWTWLLKNDPTTGGSPDISFTYGNRNSGDRRRHALQGLRIRQLYIR